MKLVLVILIFALSKSMIAQEISHFSMSSCEKDSYPQFTHNRVLSKETDGDTLNLRLGMVLNCCVEISPEVNYRNDSLFVKLTNTSLDHCSCDCCYELNFNLCGIPDTNFVIIYQSKELKFRSNKYIFPTYDEVQSIISNSSETNQFNENGRNTGLWLRYEGEDIDGSYQLTYYGNDPVRNCGVQWVAYYDSEGQLQAISTKDNWGENHIIEAGTFYRLSGVHIIKD